MLAYSTLYKIGNEEEKHNITCLNLLLTNDNNLNLNFTVNPIICSSNSSFSVGDYSSIRSEITIIFGSKSTLSPLILIHPLICGIFNQNFH
jgi:hypothetical protein